jgi:transposase
MISSKGGRAMATKGRPALAVVPFLQRESLYVGIDVGKTEHVAAFVSRTLLESAKRYEACPVLRFENNRTGFQALVTRIGEYVPLEQAFVLVEKTGHDHLALRDYLLEMDLTVHEIAPMERRREMLKTDKRDAQRLANQLYNQLELHAQVADKKQVVRLSLPTSRVGQELRGLVGHRAELVREATQRKNKLTSICDQLFPEFTQVFKDPNGGRPWRSGPNIPRRMLLPRPPCASCAPCAQGRAHLTRIWYGCKTLRPRRLASATICASVPWPSSRAC